MTSIFFALLAYFGWGIGDNVSVYLSRKTNATSVTFYAFISRLVIYILLIPFYLREFSRIDLTSIIWSLLVGMSSAVGYWFFCKGSKISNPVVVGSVAGAWGAPALLFSLVFLHESITTLQSLVIGLVFLGLILVSLKIKSFREIGIFKDRGIIYGLITMTFWAICGSFLKIPIERIGWFWTTLIFLIPFGMVFPLTRLKDEKIVNPVKKGVVKYLVLYAILITIAEIGYNNGLATGKAAIVAAIAGSNSTIFAFVAYLVYREKLYKQQVVGVFITLIGIVMLSIISAVT